jgi:hypothetical protein
MTKKEKMVSEVLFKEYKKSDSMTMKWPELVSGLKGKLTGPETAALVYKSRYFAWDGTPEIFVAITPEGINYMENYKSNIAEKWGFWIFGIFSILAAIFSFLSYLK